MFARTQRLTLRPGWQEDAPALTRAIAHDSVLMKLSRAPCPYLRDDAESFLSVTPSRGEAVCMIVAHDLSETPQLVGGIGLHRSGEDIELGYWLTPHAWGRGYATEAARAMVDAARYTLGHRRLVAGHFTDNPASARVLRKLGFRPTGRIEQRECRARGGTVACATYALELDDMPARMAA
jgi:RimJ/RimL family protein N-acetyltransferase